MERTKDVPHAAEGEAGGAPPAAPARGLWEILVLGALGGVRDEERGPFRDALRRALHRPVLPHQAWRLRVSAALLAVLAMMVLTGCLLSIRFVPTAQGAFDSVKAIDQVGFGSWFARQMHVWCGRLAVLLAGLSVLRMLVSADYKYRGRAKWVAAHLLLLVLFVFFATGASLPSGAVAKGATATLASILGDVPLVGGLLRGFLVEPEHDPQAVLTRAFVLHVVLLPWVMFFLVVIVNSTRTRPRPIPSTPSWERLEGAAPLWPDRAAEAGISVVLALGLAAVLALAWPVEAGGPARPGLAAADVDPVFRSSSGMVGLFPGGSVLLGSAAAVAAFCAGCALFFLLAFLDRGPDRAPSRRKKIVLAGVAWFVGCTLLALFGKGRP
jgi:quinol-cytochrome oxidoreductase complex cytochrome b subunit